MTITIITHNNKNEISLMVMHTLVLLGKNNIQNRIFSGYIEETLGQCVSLTKCELLQNQLPSHNRLIMIDLSSVNDAETYEWQRILHDLPSDTSTILLNVEDIHDKDNILLWPNCAGVFAAETSLDKFILGMKKVLNGEYWLPRTVMTELLQHYRADFKPSEQSKKLLTSRERDVLALLPTCKSNIEIADALFVSEHTIKSHLYKIFKKINVKNRLQAMSWIKENC
ncbi:MAG: LuxR family transcriptional regulator of csgAB operon [Cognaticolwellia sp.]|jgi:LuxR family transcriptional regulator of csgAB operon